jgi:SAM-dependent methyltransferase
MTLHPKGVDDGYPGDGYEVRMHHPEPEGPGDFELGWWPSQQQARREADEYAATYAKSWRLPRRPTVRDIAPADASSSASADDPADSLFPATAEHSTMPAAAPASFRPQSQQDLAPARAQSKVLANLAALRTLRHLQDEDRPATVEEQAELARWSGWGAVPKVFDEADEQYAAERQELKQILDDREWRAAAKTTLNAHYTDAALASVMWAIVVDGGLLTDVGDRSVRVLEPGCGAGAFLGLAPDERLHLIGVELDSTTAAIAKHLYPHADVRNESFADTTLPTDSLDLVIGNVPFGKIALHDKVHNASGHSLHNYFIVKSLALTRPGGVVAVLTSHYTMDAANPAARREIAAMADLVAAVRLPMSTHQKAAGTQVITDLLVLRRRDPDDGPGDGSEWEGTVTIGGDDQRQVCVNRHFAEHHPELVIGDTGIRSGQFGPELEVKTAPDVDVALELRARISDSLHRVAAGNPAWSLFTPPPAGAAPFRPLLRPDAQAEHQQDHLAVDPSGGFTAAGSCSPPPTSRRAPPTSNWSTSRRSRPSTGCARSSRSSAGWTARSSATAPTANTS